MEHLSQGNFLMGVRFPPAEAVKVTVKRKCFQLGMVRCVVVGHNRSIRPLSVVAIVVVHGRTVLDSNHLVNV